MTAQYSRVQSICGTDIGKRLMTAFVAPTVMVEQERFVTHVYRRP